MLHIKNIEFSFGGRTLFEGLSLHIRPQDRIGLVGPNGSGKTTLLKMVSGDTTGYTGAIDRRKGITVCRLPQEGIYRSGLTVMDAGLEAFTHLIKMEAEIEAADNGTSTATGEEMDKLLERSGELRHEYEVMGGFTFRSDTARVLTGLGFSEKDFSRDMAEFSGGWQMRVALAKLLLQKPDILLLDEPTNHLDLPAIIWFESFLQDFPGALIVVSHDRFFLDRTIRRVAEMTMRRLELYDGNYSYYEVEKIKRWEILSNRMGNQQKEIKRTEVFIERFRYKATKARQVQSRIKMLEKMNIIEMPDADKQLSFSFKANRQPGKVVMGLSDIHKSYGEKKVLTNIKLTIGRGDRLAIIGANGLGKSTLMRVIAGRTEFEGERKPGHNVDISYFSQDQYEMLAADRTVLEEASSSSAGFKGNIRSLLGVFMFSNDDVNKKVSMLSGGEKSRLLFAKMMASPANFLLLDEPTNHLDPPSQKMLEHVFRDYDGTICFVSHNRYFINAIANRIVEITPAGIEEYIGNYDDYKLQKKEREKNFRAANPEVFLEAEKIATDRKAARRERAELLAQRSRELRPIRKGLEKTESEIQQLEEKILSLETMLADPQVYSDPEKVRSLPAELKAARESLDSAMKKWEILAAELDAKEQEFDYNK